MSAPRASGYLTLVGRGPRPRPTVRPSETEPIPFPTAGASTRDAECDIATRRGLLARLELVGSIAPTSPLSLVIVRLTGLEGLATTSGQEQVTHTLRAVADDLRSVTRATDLVGRLDDHSFAIVLQGAGATAAAAVAARIGHRLAQLAVTRAPIGVNVAAATGTGRNFDTLPVAALDSLPDCG
jgi:GGDEF domain-containing protein